MDSKQKLLLIASGAICGVVILALVVFLFGQIGAMNEARQARDDASDMLTGYYASKVYPSKANRQIREQDAKTLNAWSDQARQLLATGLTVPQQESPSQFANRLSETIRALNERQQKDVHAGFAQKKEEEQVLDYSFGRYVVQNEMPKEADVPRLAAQFAVIEYVCDLLLDNGAQRILEVTREAFDSAKAEVQEEPARNARSRRSSRSRRDEKPKVAANGTEVSPVLEKDGVTCESYSIRFNARYTTLAKVLNTLVSGDLFVVVTDVAAKRQTSVKTNVEKKIETREAARKRSNPARRSRNQTPEEIAAAEAAAKKPLFADASPADRLVTDPANSMPLDITLKFDVYSVPPAEVAEAAETPAQEGK